MGLNDPHRSKEELVSPRHRLGNHFLGSSEGDMNELDSRTDPEAFRAQMRSAPDAGRCQIERAGVGFGGGDEVASRLEPFGR